jgi:hypothetical protein
VNFSVRILCDSTKFSVDVFSNPWPDSDDFEELIHLIKTKSVADSPAHQYACHVFNDSNKNLQEKFLLKFDSLKNTTKQIW